MLDKDGQPVTTANTTTLVYATMTGTDIALYHLDKTYRQLTADGVKIFELAGSSERQGPRAIAAAVAAVAGSSAGRGLLARRRGR